MEVEGVVQPASPDGAPVQHACIYIGSTSPISAATVYAANHRKKENEKVSFENDQRLVKVHLKSERKRERFRRVEQGYEGVNHAE